MHAPALRELRDALELATPGAIPSGASILPFLTRAWSYLHGASAGGMTREKLAGHVTNVHWSPPVLSFELDGDAARETWQVDLQDGTAWLSARERRELPPKEDAADLALALAKQIVAGRGSLAVIRKPGGSLSVRPGDVPGLDVGFAETLPGRHRRFRAALERAMADAGFTKIGPYRFRRDP